MRLTDLINLERVSIIEENEDSFIVEYKDSTHKVNKSNETCFYSTSGSGVIASNFSLGHSLQLTQELELSLPSGIHQDVDTPKEFYEVMIFHELSEIEYASDGFEDAHQRAVNDEIMYTFKFFDEDKRERYAQFVKEYRPHITEEPSTIETIIKYHDNSQKALEYTVNSDGKEEGLLQKWYENGQLKGRVNFVDGEEHGLWESWYQNGQKGSKKNYVNGQEDGLEQEWYENGQLKIEANFLNGKRHGLFQKWWENGQKWWEGNWDDDKLSGLWKSWHQNGQLNHEKNYVNGQEDGLCQSWYNNGQLERRGNYVNGEQDGLIQGWYEDGQEEYVANYVNGKSVSVSWR